MRSENLSNFEKIQKIIFGYFWGFFGNTWYFLTPEYEYSYSKDQGCSNEKFWKPVFRPSITFLISKIVCNLGKFDQESLFFIWFSISDVQKSIFFTWFSADLGPASPRTLGHGSYLTGPFRWIRMKATCVILSVLEYLEKRRRKHISKII